MMEGATYEAGGCESMPPYNVFTKDYCIIARREGRG